MTIFKNDSIDEDDRKQEDDLKVTITIIFAVTFTVMEENPKNEINLTKKRKAEKSSNLTLKDRKLCKTRV